MKTYIVKSLAVALLAGGMASCSDFLDQSSPSSTGGENVYSNYDFAQSAVAGIYYQFGAEQYRSRTIWYGYNTDVEVYNNSNKGDAKADLATYNAQPNNSEFNSSDGRDPYSQMYIAIERANQAVAGISAYADTTDTNFRQLLGEALTLRALFYMDLVNMWGDVPARFEVLNSDNMYIERTDRDVIYKQIISDLQHAQNMCAWPNEISTTETVERINKAFVKGLLARACMQAAGYAQRADGTFRLSNDAELSKDVLYPIALQACKDVMDKEGTCVALKSNFEDIFNNKGISGDVVTAGSESLFEVGYSNNPARGRIMMTFGVKHNSEDEITTMKKGSDVGPVPTLYWEYQKGDSRRDVTCCPFQWNKGVQTAQSLKSWSFGKFRYEWTNRLIGSGNDDGINKLYMRYADVVLMRAELENELNGPSAAAPYLEKVRKRAFGTDVSSYISSVSTSKDAMFNAIVNERGLEFAGELVRKADLVRWGMLKSKMDEAKAKMEALVTLTDYDTDHPYSQLSGHLYYSMSNFTYTRNGISYTIPSGKLNLYGINFGEMNLDPEGYTEYTDSEGKSTLWIKENSLDDVKDYLYLNDPEKRQYWPLFNVNLTDNSNLHNYEWY